jgi:1-acyl-sn-glycerol-3-phosphate acyltransferase
MNLNIPSLTGRVIFNLRGWSFEPLPEYWQPKQVIIGFPHTTILDTVMAFAGFAIVQQKGHVLVKREVFHWPYAGLLKKLGAIPVDRGSRSGLVSQMVDEFARRDEFQLAMVPEGTRNGARQLKTGFWHIAKAANVPIICWYLDNDRKKTVWAGRLMPGDSLVADLERIRKLYDKVGYQIQGLEPAEAAVSVSK